MERGHGAAGQQELTDRVDETQVEYRAVLVQPRVGQHRAEQREEVSEHREGVVHDRRRVLVVHQDVDEVQREGS